MKYCPKCGNPLPDSAQHCTKCGEAMAPAESEVPKKEWNIKKPLLYSALGLLALVLIGGGIFLGILLGNRNPPQAQQTEPEQTRGEDAWQGPQELKTVYARIVAVNTVTDVPAQEIRTEYDTAGRILAYRDPGKATELTFEYDDGFPVSAQGQLEQVEVRLTFLRDNGYVAGMTLVVDPEASLPMRYEYVFDSQGRLIERRTFQGDALQGTMTQTFDQRGNVLTYNESRTPDSAARRYENVFDESGNLLRVNSFYDGKPSQSQDFYYEEGILSYSTTYEYQGTDWYLINETTYDKHGNVTRVEEYDGGATSPTAVYGYEYTYDPQDRMVLRRGWTDGGTRNQEEFIWDNQGNQVGYILYEKDGSVISRQTRDYDTRGNLLSEMNYMGRDTLISSYEATYVALELSQEQLEIHRILQTALDLIL